MPMEMGDFISDFTGILEKGLIRRESSARAEGE